jgi:electron transfer flavoprotein alpha subunit
MSGVWAWIEHSNGAIKQIGLEVLGAGRMIADSLGQPLTALVFGDDVAAVSAAAFDYGADAVIAAADASLAHNRLEAIGPLVVQLAQERNPAVIMTGASLRGKDLTAWVAADLGAGLVPDGTALAVDGSTVKVTRPVYAGKLLADVYATSNTQILSIRSRAFPPATATGKTGSAEMVSAVVGEEAIPTKIVGFAANEGKVSLTDATIITSGGRGVGGPEGFAPIRELASVLGAAVGSSRAAVDAGWIPYEHQVGQTGKTVSPDLYIACGISGAIQHQAGMRTAKVIVAINKDEEAPIFKIAHYGLVGDLFEIVPALTAEFRKRLGN